METPTPREPIDLRNDPSLPMPTVRRQDVANALRAGRVTGAYDGLISEFKGKFNANEHTTDQQTAEGVTEALRLGDSALRNLDDIDIPPISVEEATEQFGTVPLDFGTGTSKGLLAGEQPPVKLDDARARFHDAPLSDDY